MKESNFSRKILLSKDEALRRYKSEVALSDEALEYLKTKLGGGQLIHNHPEHSALTQADIMTALYLDLGRVEALCKDGTDYILEIDVDRQISSERLSILRENLSESEKTYIDFRKKSLNIKEKTLHYMLRGSLVEFDNKKFNYYIGIDK